MIAEPLGNPGVNEIVALALPAAADNPVGAAGVEGDGVESDGHTTRSLVVASVGFGADTPGALVWSDSTCMSPAVPLMACVAVTGNQKWSRSLMPDLTGGNMAYPPDMYGAAHSPAPISLISTLLKLLISQYTLFTAVGLTSCSPAGISTLIRYVAFQTFCTSV